MMVGLGGGGLKDMSCLVNILIRHEQIDRTWRQGAGTKHLIRAMILKNHLDPSGFQRSSRRVRRTELNEGVEQRVARRPGLECSHAPQDDGQDGAKRR